MQPSLEPSGQPTAQPSGIPTQSPSSEDEYASPPPTPTPSAIPTPAPTDAIISEGYFDIDEKFNNLNASSFEESPGAELVIREAVASFLAGVNASDVNITNVESSDTFRRRLAGVEKDSTTRTHRLRRFSVKEEEDTGITDVAIRVFVSTVGSDVKLDSYVVEILDELSFAVRSGEFENEMVELAQQNGNADVLLAAEPERKSFVGTKVVHTSVETPFPTAEPTAEPSVVPTPAPSADPTPQPTPAPSGQPTSQPSSEPSAESETNPFTTPVAFVLYSVGGVFVLCGLAFCARCILYQTQSRGRKKLAKKVGGGIFEMASIFERNSQDSPHKSGRFSLGSLYGASGGFEDKDNPISTAPRPSKDTKHTSVQFGMDNVYGGSGGDKRPVSQFYGSNPSASPSPVPSARSSPVPSARQTSPRNQTQADRLDFSSLYSDNESDDGSVKGANPSIKLKVHNFVI
jgi:hypothetical protein